MLTPASRVSRSTCSSVRRTAAAATFSSRCSTLPVPGMASTWSPSASVHASRTWEVVAPTSAATSRTAAGSSPSGAAAGDREERDERDAELAAAAQDREVLRGVDGELVLDADHIGDGERRLEVGDGDVGDADVPDQALLDERGQLLDVRRQSSWSPRGS